MMSKQVKYLTLEKKKRLALSGQKVPICVGNSSSKNGFITKIRGSIFDGSLKKKEMKI